MKKVRMALSVRGKKLWLEGLRERGHSCWARVEANGGGSEARERGLPVWGAKGNGETKGYDEGVGGHEGKGEQGMVYTRR